MSDTEFACLFPIGQAMLGPNLIVVLLIGWRIVTDDESLSQQSFLI